MPIKKGDKVKVEYTGMLEDDTVFDSTEKHGGEPLEFEVGSGMMIPGFDKAVVGMEKSEEKDIELKPGEAYGEHNAELVKKLPKQGFPEDAKVGSLIGISMPNGQQLPARIISIKDDHVLLDLNHELAGKNLKFHIKIVEFSS